MSNYRQDPFINVEAIQKVQQELGRLFEGDWIKPVDRANMFGEWSPATDTIETKTDWHFLMELPGVDLKDINVSVHRGEIIVKGQKGVSVIGNSSDEANTINQERSHGSFERVLLLPDDADESTLAAAMKNGVLHLTVSKSDCSGARPINVQAAD